MFGITLRKLPWYAKWMITGYLIAIAAGYLYAMGNLALVVGLTPDEIQEHYYGNEATQQKLREEAQGPKVAAGEAVEEELDLDLGGDDAAAPAAAAAEAVPEEEILPIPSFKSLVAEGHFHIFGMTSFFFGLCLIALFLEVGEVRKGILCITPFFAILFDNVSLLATRFLGPSWVFLTIASGALMALSFLGIFVHAFYDMWLKRNPVAAATKESPHALAA